MNTVQRYLDSLLSKGRISFLSREFQNTLKLSSIGAKFALIRLRRDRLIATPVHEFNIILSAADRLPGCRPANEFIDDLMQFLSLPYYVGLLSAAEIHGAAHHRPQVFQVMVPKVRRTIECGRTRIEFIRQHKLATIPTLRQKTKSGYIAVSTPEATAFDLITYDKRSGGMDNVATVLSELAETLSVDKLVSIATKYPISSSQRLGYILDLLKKRSLTPTLKNYVKKKAMRYTPLLPGKSMLKASRSSEWKVAINENIEPEL